MSCLNCNCPNCGSYRKNVPKHLNLLAWTLVHPKTFKKVLRKGSLLSKAERKPIIYMGEWYGCCGTDSLFQQLDIVEDLPPHWERVQQEYFQWYLLHDHISLCLKVSN